MGLFLKAVLCRSKGSPTAILARSLRFCYICKYRVNIEKYRNDWPNTTLFTTLFILMFRYFRCAVLLFSPFFSSSELFNKDTSWYHVYTCNYETVQNYKGDFTRKVFSLFLGCVVFVVTLWFIHYCWPFCWFSFHFIPFYVTDSSDTEFKI